jgi:hypothetical protein
MGFAIRQPVTICNRLPLKSTRREKTENATSPANLVELAT